MRTRVALFCHEAGVHWWEGNEPACHDRGHAHHRIDVHVHRDLVRLPDDTTVVATSFDEADPYGRDTDPQFGIYLDERWRPPWQHELIEWPDFGLPANVDAFAQALRRLHERARAGQVVEVGCVGGHGRTGTTLACLAVLAGVPADHATGWARNNYCFQAVETPEQERFVTSFAAGCR